MLIYRCLDKFGLGDTLRSIFAFFVYCKINDIPFFLYLNDSKLKNYISDSFEKNKKLVELLLKDADGNRLELSSERFPKTEFFIDVNDGLKKFLDDVKDDNGGMYIVCSNLFDFVTFEQMSKYKKDFLLFLKFKKVVLERVDTLYNTIEDDFTAIHIRCGDKYMDNINCFGDERIKPNVAYGRVLNIMNYLKQKFGLKVMIFTDNNYLKTRFSQNTFNTKIGHTVTTNNTDELLDAVVEFVLLGFSVSTVTLTNSGFSFWPSFIYDVPLFMYIHEDEELKEFLVSDLKY